MAKKISRENIYLGVILLFAFILRFFNFFDLSFIHDELSALSRTNFSSFSELVSKGISVDGHPPLVQVFLYYWTGIFGYGTAIVKLPFLVVGMLSLYYLYKLCKEFSNSIEFSLAVTMFFAVNQLHLSYSSIARMYITGFLFSVALVYHWKKWMEEESKKDFLWMIAFAILATYNHHFTLFFTLIVWASGWFFVQKSQKIKYIQAGVIVLFAYIPCINITYHQLFETQGLSWMSPPDNTFTVNFLSYFLHYNPILMLFMAVGLVLSFFNKIKTNTWILLGFAWFVFIYSVAYLYSVWVAPVLQYHLMLFAFPFLVMASFSGWRFIMKDKKLIVTGLVVCLLSLYSLVVTRKHFSLFPSQPYKVLAESIKDIKQGKVLVVSNLNFSYLGFYLKDEYAYIDTLSEDRLASLNYAEVLKKYDYVICASKNEYAEAFFTPAFEPIKNSRQCQGTEIDVLKRSITISTESQLISTLDFNKNVTDWNFSPSNMVNENGSFSYIKPENDVWGPTYEAKLADTLNGILVFDITYKGAEKEGEMSLAVNFYDENGVEVYSSITNDKIVTMDKGINKSSAIVNLRSVPANAVKIKAFHWKKSETRMEILDMKLSVMKEKVISSYRNDTIITKQDFTIENQEFWTKSMAKPYATEPFGELAVDVGGGEAWFPSVLFGMDKKGIYAFEFEFLPKKISPSTRVIVSIKQDDKILYYTSRNLNSFFQSDGKTWIKAVIGIPQGIFNETSDAEVSFEGVCFKSEGDEVSFKNPMVKRYNHNPYLYSFLFEIK